MSFYPADTPDCDKADGAMELVVRPKQRHVGDLAVRRVLPARERRSIGPFVFFDHMGPATMPPGEGINVRPHPHIGLATISWLFEGQMVHRDSLGFVQTIKPGAVNLMTAGRGIVHSERAGDDLNVESTLHGIQSWMALPAEYEETEPAFAHYPSSSLPTIERGGVRVRVIMGSAWEQTSPVQALAPTLYLECVMPAGSRLDLPQGYSELAMYVVDGEVRVGDQRYAAGLMLVPGNGRTAQFEATTDARVMVIGGEPVGERHIWWNFVSSSRERIERAKADWKAGRFALVPGDDEAIPLPE